MTYARQHHRARQCPTRPLSLIVLLVVGLGAMPPGAVQAQVTAKAATSDKAADKAAGGSSTTQSIVVLVNDEPITGYEVEERAKLSFLGSNDLQERLKKKLKAPGIDDQFKAFAIKRLKANPPKSEEEQQTRIRQLQQQFVESLRDQVEADFRPAARKNALDELIEERLKLQEAKRLNVVAANEDVDRVINGMAERNKMTPKEFADHVAKMGANITAMRERIKASLSWNDVIRRRFGHQIQLVGKEIERLSTAVAGDTEVELHVHRILLPFSAKANETQAAQRLSEAERLRAQFTDCKGTSALAASVAGARFDDLGQRKPGSIPEPTRSLLMSARDNEMIPPAIGEGGVELWAVCERKTLKSEDQQRQTAENDLRQKEFEILSKKHLKDLRQDAHIEYR
jgi:peptidyl-prolyl cis-trans isomerase SurA